MIKNKLKIIIKIWVIVNYLINQSSIFNRFLNQVKQLFQINLINWRMLIHRICISICMKIKMQENS